MAKSTLSPSRYPTAPMAPSRLLRSGSNSIPQLFNSRSFRYGSDTGSCGGEHQRRVWEP